VQISADPRGATPLGVAFTHFFWRTKFFDRKSKNDGKTPSSEIDPQIQKVTAAQRPAAKKINRFPNSLNILGFQTIKTKTASSAKLFTGTRQRFSGFSQPVCRSAPVSLYGVRSQRCRSH
jgi:hypothetical protein